MFVESQSMANMFCVQKVERSKLRKLPMLPRFAVTVEFAGRQFIFKQAPFLETLLNVKDRGFSLKNLLKVAAEELDEIRLPAGKRPLASVKDLHAKSAEGKVKKAPAKAAAKKKATEAPAT
jgi:hypothetical protein